MWIISPLALHGVNGNRRNWAPARLSGDVGPELHGRTAWRRAAGLWRGPGRNPAHAILRGYRVCGVREPRKTAAAGAGHRRPASPLVQPVRPNCSRQGKSTGADWRQSAADRFTFSAARRAKLASPREIDKGKTTVGGCRHKWMLAQSINHRDENNEAFSVRMSGRFGEAVRGRRTIARRGRRCRVSGNNDRRLRFRKRPARARTRSRRRKRKDCLTGKRHILFE